MGNKKGYIPWNKGKKGLQIAWNKGLTKELDTRVKNKANAQVGKKGCPAWNKGLTKDTDERIKKCSGKNIKKSLHKIGKKHTKEWCENQSKSLKGHVSWNIGLTKETNESVKKASDKNTGELHFNWKGGDKDYGCDFTNELKIKIKNRDNWHCANPWCKSHCTKLDVHHINYKKKDNRENNLITLCVSCHSKTNYNRIMYEYFYKLIMEGILWRQFKKVS
jgi:hypothetical protein